MPVVCVEAKSKGTNLKKCAPKLLQYTNAFKDTVKYALLTDGLVWQFYDCTNMNAHQEFDLASNHFGGAVKPSHFRLPDGEVVAIKIWKAVLLESCKYVLSKVENLQLPLVDKAGKSTLLISETKPSAKLSFVETSYQDKTVYIYLNYESSRCIANAAYILKQYLPESQKALPAVVIA